MKLEKKKVEKCINGKLQQNFGLQQNMHSTKIIFLLFQCGKLIFQDTDAVFYFISYTRCITTKVRTIDIFRGLFLLIWSPERWILSVEAHMANFFGRIILFMGNLEQGIIGPKDIIQKVILI